MSHSWIISNIFRLPYDWRNPFGYMFAVSYQLITFLGVLEIFVTCLVIYLGVCKFSIAFADDFVANFGEISHKIGECNGNFTSNKQTILNQQLTEIMDFQVNAVQLSVHFENIRNQTLLISSFLFFHKQAGDTVCKTLQEIHFDDFLRDNRVSLPVFATISSGKSRMSILTVL